jgi:hypothetical protein
MAEKKGALDVFSSKSVLNMVESAANTLTYDKVETGMSIYDKVGWVISRIEYQFTPAAMALFNGTGDYAIVGLSSTNSILAAGINAQNPALYTFRTFQRLDLGVAATGMLTSGFFVDDYSTMPGGGLFVLPAPLYGYIIGSGLTGAITIPMIVYASPMTLTDTDYFNLVQSRQLLINS